MFLFVVPVLFYIHGGGEHLLCAARPGDTEENG